MNSITQEQEAVNDALQMANEELLSGSEELQSLNEELETSKEESQTSNEELMVLNQELYDRNEQLNILKLYAESIVTTIREPLVILDKNLCIKSANRAFYHKFQTFEEETEGKLFFDLGSKDWDVPALRQKLEKVNASTISVVDFEMTRDFSVIGERTMQLNATRLYRDKSEDHFILLAIEDVTEKRKVEQALKEVADLMEKQVADRTSSLKEMNVELSRSNKNLEQFAYIASHDLQEPLRKIRTFTGMLNERYVADLPPAAKELLVRIAGSAERMTTLIQDVLSFSKVLHADTGFEKTDLNNVLLNVLKDFDLVITEKKAIVNWQHLPIIEAIPLQMNQLFQNLVSNALKFCSTSKPPVITITHFLLTLDEVKQNNLLDDSLVYCEIDIKDNGVGFEQQYADQVFVLFNRLHGRKEFAGTGIGLALCKSIAINHHGDISAESALNEGALFKIILPINQKDWGFND
jgi:two-component system CheB/CheR fusion protein